KEKRHLLCGRRERPVVPSSRSRLHRRRDSTRVKLASLPKTPPMFLNGREGHSRGSEEMGGCSMKSARHVFRDGSRTVRPDGGRERFGADRHLRLKRVVEGRDE